MADKRSNLSPQDVLRREILNKSQTTPQDVLAASRPSFVDEIGGMAETFENMITDAFSAGFKDEARAAGGAVGDIVGRNIATLVGGTPPPELANASFGELFSKHLQGFEEERQKQRERDPGTALAGTLTGAFAAGAPRAGKALVTQTPSFLKNILIGGGFGTVTGFGSTEGDVVDRTYGAGTGLIFGLGFSAALTGLVRAVSAVGQRALTKTERTAFNDLMRAFERDGISPEDATKKLAQWQAQGAKPEVLADLGGDNVKGLLRAAVSIPSQARSMAEKTFAPRQFQQSERVFKDALKALAPGTAPRTASLELAAARAKAAKPLYEAAYLEPLQLKGVQYTIDDLMEILNRPTMRKAVRVAYQHAADLKKSLPRIIDKDGKITEVPDVEFLDWIKREGLDTVYERFRDSTTGKVNLKDPAVRVVDTLRRQFIEIVDDLAPAYKAARDAFAGPSASLSAIERGQAFVRNFRRSPAATEEAVKSMSQSEKEFFRIGVAQSVQDIVENSPDGADVVKRLFGTPRLREAMRLVMPSEEALVQFEQAIEREANMFRTGRIAGFESGSPTARIAEEVADLAADVGITPGKVLEAVTTGSPRPLAGGLFQKLSGGQKQALKADVADAIGKILMAGEPEEIVRLLGVLERSTRVTKVTTGVETGLAKGSGIFGGDLAGEANSP